MCLHRDGEDGGRLLLVHEIQIHIERVESLPQAFSNFVIPDYRLFRLARKTKA